MYKKLATELDNIADKLQSAGLVKLAEELDIVSNTMERMASIGPTGVEHKYIGAKFLGYNYKSLTMNQGDLIKREWGDQATKEGVVSPEGKISKATDGGTLVYVIDPKATGADKTRPINLGTFTGTVTYSDGRVENLENAKKLEDWAAKTNPVKPPGEEETPNLEGVMYRGKALIGSDKDGTWTEMGEKNLLGNNGTGKSRKDGKGLWIEIASSKEGAQPAFFLLPSFNGISYKGSEKEIYIDGKKEDLSRFKASIESHYKKLGSDAWKALETKYHSIPEGLSKLESLFVSEVVKLGGNENLAYILCPFRKPETRYLDSTAMVKKIYAISRGVPTDFNTRIDRDFSSTTTTPHEITSYGTLAKVLKVIDTHFNSTEAITRLWDEATASKGTEDTKPTPAEEAPKADEPKTETPPAAAIPAATPPAEDYTKAAFTGKGLLKIQRDGKWQEMEKPLAGNLSTGETHKDEKGTWVEIKSKKEGGPSAYLLVDSFVGDVEKDGKKANHTPVAKEASISYSKLAHVLDTVSNELQAKGLLKQAAELDLVANELDAVGTY